VLVSRSGWLPDGRAVAWESAEMHADGTVYFAGEGVPHPLDEGQEAIPDLTDPDSRAAYDRRLALELGATQEQVAEGVAFGCNAGGEWWIACGFLAPIAEARSTWHRRLDIRAEDTPEGRLLARALAWPADRRSA
jgi:hypothetical protein